jgi:hypothetical protein
MSSYILEECDMCEATSKRELNVPYATDANEWGYLSLLGKTAKLCPICSIAVESAIRDRAFEIRLHLNNSQSKVKPNGIRWGGRT